MSRIGIIGAGMAGLACAEKLSGQSHELLLFDKGRGPGGRMSTRRVATALGDAGFDHGAQYFTIRDPGFRACVLDWIVRGIVAPWPAAGPDAYVGLPGMNAPIAHMAARHSVRWATQVTRIDPSARGWRLTLDRGEALDLDIAVVATAAEQASALLAAPAPDFAARARSAPSAPCWTVMAAFAAPLPTDLDCLRGEAADTLSWAARNSAKPGRTGPEAWVLQASPAWSRLHLEADADGVATALLAALSARLRTTLVAPIACSAHRWRYARTTGEGSGAAWDARRRLGLCGDWLIGPRVEAAWMAGTRLGAWIAAPGDMNRG